LFCFLLQVNLQAHAASGEDQMKNRLLDNERIKRASLYITAAVLCVLILCVFYKIWRADLRVPFFYSGDSLFYSMFVRTTLDNGSYWQNPAIGAPGGMELYDFPGLDNSVAIQLVVFSLFTHNAMLVLNLFYLLTFPFVTLTSLYVLRQFNVSFVPAVFCSLLYSFLPYHFMRNETHFLFSAYYVVPVAILVVLWVSAQELSVRSRKFVIALVICVVLGASGVYYPFFFCFLLLIAGAIGALKFHKLRPLGMALIFVAVTCGSIAANLSPSFIYKHKHGDVGVVKRSAGESERYGLRISQMVLPVTSHRLGPLSEIKTVHNASTLVTENDTASLGLVGTVGFLGLLVQLLSRKELLPNANGLFHDLSVLNIFAVLLGIIGGFALLFAVLVSSGIRSYNRISTYIAFFSLMAVGLALERVYRRTAKTAVSQSIFCGVMAIALLAGFLDQTIPGYVPDYRGTKAEFSSDAEFVQRLESTVPPGSMIFQLPYIPFPEDGGLVKMRDYDHFRGYLHSRNLRWSYGTIKNRPADRAQQMVATLPAEKFVQALAFRGFSGIYLDRHGYEDGGAAKEAELSNVLQTKPLVSPNGRLVFFNLTDYNARLRGQISESEWKAKAETSFQPVLLDWKGAFSDLETLPGKSWRWCGAEGELHINNTSPRTRVINLEMAFATGYREPSDLIITGLISEQLKVGWDLVSFSKTISVPPGESVITFRSNAKRIDAPLDPRFLVFRIENFKMTELQ
jgi:phosphoglycerol transferase